MIAFVRDGIRRIFEQSGPPRELTRLGNHLFPHGGGGLMSCGCRGIMTPVLARLGNQTEVVGVACLRCHKKTPVCVGVLIADSPHMPETVR
jgi:hypothetical protein